MTKPYAVLGITGHVGKVVAEHLLKAGLTVRGLVPDANAEGAQNFKNKGVKLFTGKLDDTSVLTSLFTDIEAAFIMIPPLPSLSDPDAEAAKYSKAIAEALKSTNVPRIVVLSSLGAQHSTGVGVVCKIHTLEETLRPLEKQMSIAFLRAGYFMHNVMKSLHTSKSKGTFPSFDDESTKLPCIAPEDIGEASAKLMRESWTGLRIINLFGPKEISCADMAKDVSEILGKEIKPEIVPKDKWKDMLSEGGMSSANVDQLMELHQNYKQYMKPESGTETMHTSTTFKQWAATVLK